MTSAHGKQVSKRANSEVGPYNGDQLGADGGTEGGGDGLGEALDVGIVFGFDHDAGELFGAGVAKNDAAVLAKRGIGFGERSDHVRKRLEGRLGFYLHVDDGLRIVLEAGDERIEATF